MPKILRLNTMSIVTNPNPARENSVSFQCPILTPTNYNTWSIKMEAIMDAHGLWDAIEPPTGAVVDEKKSKQARAFIFQSIPDEVLLQAAKKKTAKEVWDSLKSRYVGAERVQKARLHILKSEFEGLQMKDGESIDEYAGKLSGMVSKYNSDGAKLDDEELVRKLFDTVPERFINLVASIEQSSDVETMPFEEAIAHLKAYEDRVRLRQSHQAAENSLLFSKSEPQTSSKGHGKSRQFSNQKSGGRGKADQVVGMVFGDVAAVGVIVVDMLEAKIKETDRKTRTRGILSVSIATNSGTMPRNAKSLKIKEMRQI
ncbi:hypothetical protein L1987_12614 [Smallanthus sonchifolius]|uniref:Uncharacterized protein n=1 Tax=Smallanthus sonchifolius TaxID=185202 RepID=A0ACB9JF56_9ASTR|nr:hypothetical protein L1987_12614 [Smallanthus sonchifolius]